MDANVAGAAVGEVTKCSIVHAEREFGYLVYFKRNKTNLMHKVEQLKATINDVQRLVDAAVNNSTLIRDSVRNWLADAAAAQEAGTQLTDEAALVNSWFKGWCCSRFSIGKRAAKMIPRIQGLLDERTTAFGELVSDPKPAQSLQLISNGDFEVFASRDFTTTEVLDALKHDGINLVGVYGMPGAGKTMLVKALASHVKEEKMFEEVVMVIVSQNPDMKKIQGEIAKRLSLSLEDDDSISLRAERLSERLNQGKKTLVILDDLWERVELSDVGIPWKTACKVLFTTRSQEVCNSMEAQKKIKVKVLSEQDSWLLFQGKVGHEVDSIPLQSVARAVVMECQGLPLAIATIGRALRDKNANVWAAALAQLKKSNFEGMTPVISSIKWSYDNLPNQETKLCFLFCALFPEDSQIRDQVLLWYLMGEKLIRDVDCLEEARGRLHVIVDKLVSSCLLLGDIYHELYVDHRYMIHDVVRDAAIQIASKHEETHGFIVKARMKLTEWPDMELEKCKRLSLMSNNIRCVFPSQIRAPHLLTLSLNDNSEMKEIPEDLFSEMKSLLTLDLSGTAIELLPSSLACLVNLCTLLLVECRSLKSASPIESLKKLEILVLSESGIKSLSEELGSLTNLKLLDLSDMERLKTISPKLISSLSRLEELNVTNFCSWEIDETGEGRNASLTEVISLTRLTSLRIHIGNLECLYMNIIPNHWSSMLRFTILVVDGKEYGMSELYIWSRKQNGKSMGLQLLSSVCVAGWVRKLLDVINCLLLIGCHCLESIEQLDPTWSTDGLKVLYVQNCNEMRHLLGSSTTGVLQKGPNYALRNLEELNIVDVKNFEAICKGTVPEGVLCKLKRLSVRKLSDKILCLIPSDLLLRLQMLENLSVRECSGLEMLHDMSSFSSSSPIFPNLRNLYIWCCDKLKYIFPMRVFRHLKQLYLLDVQDCEDMEVIIYDENDEVVQVKEEDDTMILPQLKCLSLNGLPSLRSFSGRDSLVVCLPDTEELIVRNCMNLKRLPFSTNSVPKLKWFFVATDEEWFDGLEWEDQSLKSRLENLLVKISRFRKLR